MPRSLPLLGWLLLFDRLLSPSVPLAFSCSLTPGFVSRHMASSSPPLPTPPVTPPPAEYDPSMVKTVIDNILESALPYFVTGHPRMAPVLTENPSLMRKFSVHDTKAFYILCANRKERPETLDYIFARLPDETRLVLHQVGSHHARLPPDERTKLAITLMVGYMACFQDCGFRLDLRRYADLKNVTFAIDVARQPANVRSLDVQRASLQNVAQTNLDFSRLAVFQYMDQ